MDSGGIWPGDESYFQNIRETALQDTTEQLTKELAEARIANKQYLPRWRQKGVSDEHDGLRKMLEYAMYLRL